MQFTKKRKISTANTQKSHRNIHLLERLRNINVILFLSISLIMFGSMFFIINRITNTVSQDYAKLYADNAVGTLNTYLNEEIALITKVSQSNALIHWFEDEENPVKKQAAYDEIQSTIQVSSSKHLYIGILDTLSEYNVEGTDSIDSIHPLAKLSTDLPKDDWFFECIESNKDYLLNVDIDKAFHRELVWLNCKVQRDGVLYGVVCVGLDFSQVLNDLFSEYETADVRSLIIDESGNVQMDSTLTDSQNFYYAIDKKKNINNQITNVEFLQALQAYTEDSDGYYAPNPETTVLNLEGEEYQYVTIAPIYPTTWSVVTQYNSSALFDMTNLLPLVVVMAIVFVLLIVATNSLMMTYFINPFQKLVISIEHISQNLNAPIYGTDREDEIGELANSVEKMKHHLIDVLNKVYFDALTGIYNRRYLDDHFSTILESLSRSGGGVSVLMIDIDHFKKYNDTYGHSAGDECLKKIAGTITKSILRKSDFVARYGGEEFIVVLPNADKNAACFVADKILKNIQNMALPHSSSETEDYVTVSIGIMSGKVDYTTTSLDFINLADDALYVSKQTGRNKYTIQD